MMEQDTQQAAPQDPRAVALTAAEALAAAGEAVTARSVRAAAGVQMAVAADVAREWKAREVAAGAVPQVPEVVTARLVGVWAEAVQAARAEHEHAVQGWRAQLEQVGAERDEAITAADETATAAQQAAEQVAAVINDLRDQLSEQASVGEGLRQELAAAAAGLATAREEAAEARGQATVLREEITRLRTELAGTGEG